MLADATEHATPSSLESRHVFRLAPDLHTRPLAEDSGEKWFAVSREYATQFRRNGSSPRDHDGSVLAPALVMPTLAFGTAAPAWSVTRVDNGPMQDLCVDPAHGR
jgi:hypothetical protein